MNSTELREFKDKVMSVPPMWVGAVNTGRGTAPCHHGEILQGVFEEESGKETRGLVTLLNPDSQSIVTFEPIAGHSDLTVEPGYKRKALAAAKLTLEELGLQDLGGLIRCESDVLEELGLGSSTADVVATIRAICTSVGRLLSREAVARIAVAAEQASDPIMYEKSTVLFAQREGHVIEDLGPLLPEMSLMSFTLGDPVKTCHYRAPDYSWEDLQQFKPLRGLLRFALANNDLATVAKVSTHSAMINQSHIPKPRFDSILKLVDECGALGMQIAHSGNLVGLIFSPDDSDLALKLDACHQKLAGLGIVNSTFYPSI